MQHEFIYFHLHIITVMIISQISRCKKNIIFMIVQDLILKQQIYTMGNNVDEGISSASIPTFQTSHKHTGNNCSAVAGDRKTKTESINVRRAQKKLMSSSYCFQKSKEIKTFTVEQNCEDIMSSPLYWKFAESLSEELQQKNKAAVEHKKPYRFKSMYEEEDAYLAHKQQQNNQSFANCESVRKNISDVSPQQGQEAEDKSMLLNKINIERKKSRNQVLWQNRAKLELQEKSSESIGELLNDALTKIDMCDRLSDTLQNLHQIFQEFAVQEAVSVEKFREIILRYQQKNDELLTNNFLPLFVSIHAKIYKRMKKDISQRIETELTQKQGKGVSTVKQLSEVSQMQKQYSQMFSIYNSEQDLTGKSIFEKIDALMAEQRRQKQQQIDQLKRRFTLQLDLVKSVRSKNNELRQEKAQLSKTLVELQKDYESLQSKTKKLQEKLQKFEPIVNKLRQKRLHNQNQIESKIVSQSSGHNKAL